MGDDAPEHTVRGDVGKPSSQTTVLHDGIIEGLILELAFHGQRLKPDWHLETGFYLATFILHDNNHVVAIGSLRRAHRVAHYDSRPRRAFGLV